jgi:transcriptional regulator with PAS, ATPase and Fis domain
MTLLHRVVVVSRKSETQELARQIASEVFLSDDLVEALDIAETASPDLTLIEGHFCPQQIREFRDTAERKSIRTTIAVVADGNDSESDAELFLGAGAHHYLQGEAGYARLHEIAAMLTTQSQTIPSERPTSGGSDFFSSDFTSSVSMVGRSKAICETIRMIQLVGSSQCNPVLILGETGTGKEVAAKAIHILRHPNEPFVAINCAALTATLMESELFGHVKGSFTSADRDKTGLLELAASGTVFLDEISEMPLDLQAKLLRILQEKTFRKVGGTKDITCNATIIASSNRNLKKEIQAKRFRQDLYYRLNVCPIIIPPLRFPDRREDISLLAEYFLKTSTICSDKQNKIKSLTKLALEALQEHTWPGNVRELRNVIERAILIETTDKIGLSSIVIEPIECDEPCDQVFAGQTAKTKDFSLAKAERELIARALHETDWQKTQAAALLGITRATLYAKVKQYNIKKDPHLVNDLRHTSAPTEPAMAV